MTFIIEFEGVIIDLRPVYYRLHQRIAEEVGWSCLDERTFWRLTRTKGRDANVLPEARPSKLKDYRARFNEGLDGDSTIDQYALHNGTLEALNTLAKRGPCGLITGGINLPARRRVVERTGLTRYFTLMQTLDPNPRGRPDQLQALAADDQRAVVVASTDSVIRAADQAGLFTAGVASGSNAGSRLHQAGAHVVYPDIHGLVESLSCGAGDMIRAGLLPPPLA